MRNFFKNRILIKIFELPKMYALYRYYKHSDIGLLFRKKSYPIRDVVVCGMPRSGSTLLFNLVKDLLAIRNRQRDTYFNFDEEYRELLTNEISCIVKKNHRYSILLKKRIEKKLTIGIFTHRDIRDVVVSLVQKGRILNFEEWLNKRKLRKIVNDALLYANMKNIILIAYEDLINNKKEVISRLSDVLKISLSKDEIDKLIQKTDIKIIKVQLGNMNDDITRDVNTQLHKNHISDGLIGKWKQELSKEQIDIINKTAVDFLNFFGYLS